jgi:hypothetical protein
LAGREEAVLAEDSCPSCGEPRPGRYCAHCGEKTVEPDDFSVRHLFSEAIQGILNVESNAFRSLTTLITRPGLLTTEYLQGKRVRYLKPLQLFLLCNLLFFLVQSYIPFNTLTTPLRVHMHRLPYSAQVRPLVEQAIQKKQTTYPKYEERFNAVVNEQAKTFVIAMVPVFAIVLQLCFGRARRYYGEHFIFALHFNALLLLFLIATNLLLNLSWWAQARYHVQIPLIREEGGRDLLIGFLLLAYFYTAARRVYPASKRLTMVRSLIAFVGFVAVLQLYRLLLFFLGYWYVGMAK